MAIPFRPRRRSADATAPTTANLTNGEIAVNSVSKTIYQRVGANIIAIANYFSGAWADITGKPTTISGYGITDAYTKTQSDASLALKVDSSGDGYFSSDANSVIGAKIGAMASPTTNTPTSSWTQIAANTTSNGAWGYQIGQNWFEDGLYVRRLNNGTWQPWVNLWHTGNLRAPITSAPGDVTKIKTLTAAAYAALSPKDSTTLYLVY